MKKTLLTIASGIVAFALVIGFWIFGYFMGNGNLKIYIPIAAVCGAIIIFAVIFNLIASHNFTKKINAMRVQEVYDFGNKLKSDVEKNYPAAEKSVKRTITLTYVYVVLLIALIAVLSFSFGAMRLGAGASVVPVLLCAYTQWGLVDIFFTLPDGVKPKRDYEITQSEFPLLFETVKRAAVKSGCKKPVKMHINSSGVYVSEQKGKVAIHIGYMEFAMFTSEELYNVMLHEFAHVVNADSRRGATFAQEEQRWEKVSEGGNPLSIISNLLTTYPSALIFLKTNTYYLFSSRHHEIQADETVKRLGSTQDYVNALSKSGMIMKFRDMPCRELEYDFFAPEKCTGDYAKQEYETFLKYRKRYAEIWKTQFDRELPARVDSHPTFKMRLQAMQCENYDPFTTDGTPDYAEEQKKYIELCDRVFNEKQAPLYDEYRENLYIGKKGVIDEYCEAEKNGNRLSDGKLLTALQAFARIDGDRALSIAKELLKNNPKNSKVNYITGEILYHRYDKGCVEHLYTAAKDYLYTDSAMEYIGRFALLSGDEELLEKYRKDVPEVYQKSQDYEKNLIITNRTEIYKCNLTDSEKSSIYAGVSEIVGDIFQSIYIGAFKSKTGEEYYAVVPVFKSDYDKNKYNDYMTAIDNFFSLHSNGNFILINDDSPTAKLIKNADGTLIYNS